MGFSRVCYNHKSAYAQRMDEPLACRAATMGPVRILEGYRVNNIDSKPVYTEIDPKGMTKLVLGLPEQCEHALAIAKSAELPEIAKPENLLILGMGGSAIGGDLLRMLLEREVGIPIAVNRDYLIPAYVGKGSLVVASSYSGNTEETLSGYDQAKARGAQILVIASGGKLVERAKADGFPAIIIPGGMSPRAMIGYSFVPLYVVLQRIGVLADKSADFAEMVATLRAVRDDLNPDVPVDSNPAKKLALQVYGKIPVIHGSCSWKAVVATRWKGQINENSKALAYHNTYPELNHNEIVGWESPVDLLKVTEIINLRDEHDLPQIQKRIDVTKLVSSKVMAGVSDIWARGESDLARMFSLIYIGDFLSLYLALAYGNDPTPVKSIDFLKGELAKA
jgi:glucose/mannose-6-phosphate isomerase